MGLVNHSYFLFFYIFCLYNSLFYNMFNTQGIQGRQYKFYLAILACPYLVIHIIHLCTLKKIISELDFLNLWHTFNYDFKGGAIAQLVSHPPLKLGDLGLNPDGELTRVTQCVSERGRDYQL